MKVTQTSTALLFLFACVGCTEDGKGQKTDTDTGSETLSTESSTMSDTEGPMTMTESTTDPTTESPTDPTTTDPMTDPTDPTTDPDTMTTMDTESDTVAPDCGNDIIEEGEECDEGGNNSDVADCTADCKVAVCGDGLTHAVNEECDDGMNNSDNAACTSMCKLAQCEDGLVQFGVEQCDLGPETEESKRICDKCKKVGLLVFVSSEVTDGSISEPDVMDPTFTGIEAADAICNRLANQSEVASSLGGRDGTGQAWPYKAWLSGLPDDEPPSHPSARFLSLDLEVGLFLDMAYVRPDLVVIANNAEELTSGTLISSISITEHSEVVDEDANVWTNTNGNGEYAGPVACNIVNNEEGPVAWSQGLLYGTGGKPVSVDSDWTNATEHLCTDLNHLYCFEQVVP